MIWKDVKILTPIIKKDRLGADFETGEYATELETRGRDTPADETLTTDEKRDQTKIRRAIVLPVEKEQIPGNARLEMENIIYSIESVKAWRARWTICYVVKYK